MYCSKLIRFCIKLSSISVQLDSNKTVRICHICIEQAFLYHNDPMIWTNSADTDQSFSFKVFTAMLLGV